MNSSNLRQEFLDFFEKRGHKVVPSSSLIPNDPTVLFTTAGMQQFKPYFLGEKSPYGDTAVSCQKCLRTSDIDDVGDESHLTFFEMLGNFSFGRPTAAGGGEQEGGGYFKKETIEMALEFLTKNCKLSPDKLWFTYFKGGEGLPEDIESKKIFLNLGIPEEKIFSFGKDESFWGPTGDEGPCGPTAEIHYELRGKPCKLGKKCVPNCSCGRFVELWNLVFNEYYKNKEGKLSSLEQKGVDTGLGLERLAAACQNKATVFETDLFEPLIEELDYSNYPRGVRILCDHIKGVVFLAAEGIVPEKVGRGYVLRRLLRKAVREKDVVRAKDDTLITLAKKIIEIYRDVYPELASNEADILTIIQKEEESFEKAIEAGRKEYNKLSGPLTGATAFNLYSTYSIPLEITLAWAKEDGREVKDIDDFYKLQKEHQEISRAGMEKKFGGIGKEASPEAIKLHTATHLLHSALREVLGDKVQQMGSDITPGRLRFDFSFDRKLTDEEIKTVKDLVNQKIKEDLIVRKEEMSLKEALESGALSFFKEKYPEKVSVYSVGDPSDSSGQVFSKEICAGPHVGRTGELGQFKIVKQESVGAGTRRVKAILQ